MQRDVINQIARIRIITEIILADWSPPRIAGPVLISQNVSIKSFCKSQFPHKFVNIFFMFVKIKDMLTDLCGNRLSKMTV